MHWVPFERFWDILRVSTASMFSLWLLGKLPHSSTMFCMFWGLFSHVQPHDQPRNATSRRPGSPSCGAVENTLLLQGAAPVSLCTEGTEEAVKAPLALVGSSNCSKWYILCDMFKTHQETCLKLAALWRCVPYWSLFTCVSWVHPAIVRWSFGQLLRVGP